MPHGNITLNPANKGTDQSLSDFQTSICTTAPATLDTEVHELITKINYILDTAVSKWVGNAAYILAYLFNSASLQYQEVWASQMPFPHNIKDTVPPS